MHYEITVSKKDYGHLFATAERSVNNIYALKKLYNILTEKFPESEGYKINVTKWEKTGEFIDMENLKD